RRRPRRRSEPEQQPCGVPAGREVRGTRDPGCDETTNFTGRFSTDRLGQRPQAAPHPGVAHRRCECRRDCGRTAMIRKRIGWALLIAIACAGALRGTEQGRGTAPAPAPAQQGRGADAEIPGPLQDVAMPWPPMHIYLRGGLKSHGPGLHDYPQFLADWSKLLTERGAIVDGGFHFPTTA